MHAQENSSTDLIWKKKLSENAPNNIMEIVFELEGDIIFKWFIRW